MKRLCSIILVIVLLATAFSTAINFGIAAAAPKNHIQKAVGSSIEKSKAVELAPSDSTPVPTPTVSIEPPLENKFTAVAETVYGYTDSIVIVPVKFVNVPTEGISTANMTISYDPSKLEYIDSKAGDIVTNSSINFEENGASNGKVRLLFLDFTMKKGYIAKDGVFAYLIFNVVDSPSGATPITIDKAAFGNKNWESVNATLIGGKVDFASPSSSTPAPTPIATPTSILTSNALKLTAAKCASMPGKLVTVPIKIENIPQGGISVIHTKIRFNPNVLEYISSEAGSIIRNPTANFNSYTSDDGVLNLAFTDYSCGDELITNNGILANIQFKARYSNSEVSISNPNIYDNLYQAIDVISENGYVSISSALSKTILSGYISPDFLMTASTEAESKSGFKIELEGSMLSDVTDSSGYFEISNILPGTYNVRISKANYLTRQILNVPVNVDGIKLSTAALPTLMWAGDVEVKGSSDGSINMEDIVEVSKAYNSSKTNSKYQKRLDINLDGAINLEDICIISKHFNESSANYQ